MYKYPLFTIETTLQDFTPDSEDRSQTISPSCIFEEKEGKENKKRKSLRFHVAAETPLIAIQAVIQKLSIFKIDTLAGIRVSGISWKSKHWSKMKHQVTPTNNAIFVKFLKENS